MSDAEDHLHRAVDEVLEPAFPREQRRVAWRSTARALGRVAGLLLGVWIMGLVARLLFGLVLPWTFFALLALISTGVVLHQSRESLRGQE
jgi:hypothetical protein